MPPHTLALSRAAVGFVQGLALYGLAECAEAGTWPATAAAVYAPLLAVALFAPLVFVAGLGQLRPRTLAIWSVAAVVLCAGMAFYDIFRDPGDAVGSATGASATARIMPTASMWLALAAIVFIAHSLVVAGEADRKFIATYPRHFDVSWKQGVQLVLAAVFVGLFWALLWLGAELFRLIKIEFLTELIKTRWFAIPVTALVFTLAVHVTDMRAEFVRGTRTLVLTLLSWLLPVMTLLAVTFVLALPFTGLEPLWSTRRATAILLASVAVLVFLINNTYQDGRPDKPVPTILRYSSLVAAVALVPLVALAAYGLALRVGQYGWTTERIVAAACVAVAGCYALGYALAAALPGAWLRRVEPVNVGTAFVIVAILLALNTPVADPARMSVADQVARLEAGTVSVDQFDFAFLRFGSGRFGAAALERLKTKQDGPDAARISLKANEALDWKSRNQARRIATRESLASRAANITVVEPAGQPVPSGLLEQDWGALPNPWRVPSCLTAAGQCKAILADVDGDGKPEVIVFGLPAGPAAVFKQAGETWRLLGTLGNLNCAGVRDALQNGSFRLSPSEFSELDIGGQRVRIETGCKPG